MFRYVTSIVTKYSDHPFMVGAYIVSALFLVASVVVQSVTGNGVASGFLMIYAMFAAVMGGLGYGLLIVSRMIARFRRQADRSL